MNSSSDDTLQVERRGHVAVLTLNRPQAMHAINLQLRGHIHDALESLRHDSQVRVAVLTALIATQDTALAHADTLITALRGAVRQRECRILALPCPSRLTTLAATALAVLVWRR